MCQLRILLACRGARWNPPLTVYELRGTYTHHVNTWTPVPQGRPTFVGKVGLAGGAVYVAHDQGLLGSGSQGEAALEKAKAAVPPALQEWASYFGWELPATPKLDFSLCDSWNWGVQKSIGALSVAPTRACEYTTDGWNYMKGLVK